jgi:hypothetical protein
MARTIYLTKQHYRKTVPEREDNNMFSTEHLILDIKYYVGNNINKNGKYHDVKKSQITRERATCDRKIANRKDKGKHLLR